jgi:hypothetical protein
MSTKKQKDIKIASIKMADNTIKKIDISNNKKVYACGIKAARESNFNVKLIAEKASTFGRL